MLLWCKGLSRLHELGKYFRVIHGFFLNDVVSSHRTILLQDKKYVAVPTDPKIETNKAGTAIGFLETPYTRGKTPSTKGYDNKSPRYS